ncbi:substrate-binding domain-containing protein [Streptomyces sp. NPDC059786]|uniref:substrate-binding domain-containing protein n=1 Tax=Streptomyces sp. NPDC059786 TaxID=3346946 RepID=UPI003649CC92
MEAEPSSAPGWPAPNRPLTIGLLTANIHLGVGATLWSGARAAAERNGVNLVCFPGGNLRHRDSARSALYELVGPARLDGVVCWSSTLGLPAPGAAARRLLRQLAHLPVISVNHPLNGETDVLSIDSHTGMRKLVGHLVVRHGRRRPACIRGPLDNPVSEDRYHAYVDALRHHGIQYDHTYVCAAADFAATSGASAMRVLMEARGLRPGTDFDAVVACSDVLAADALRFLTERGVRVPADVAVVGFNDSPEAQLGDPPLTSVALPFAELGALAVDTLVARLRGTRPPDRTTVPATLVPRRSCGCRHTPAQSPLTRPPPTAQRADRRGGAGPPGWSAFEPVLPGARHSLARAFHTDLAGTASAGPASAGDGTGDFLPLVERLLRAHADSPSDVDRWQEALERARRDVVGTLPAAVHREAEVLFGRAHLIAAERSRGLLEYERWAQGRQDRRLREFGRALTMVVDLEGLADVLERHSAEPGLPPCRIVLYDRARSPDDAPVRGMARPLLTQPERRVRGHPGALDSPPFPASTLLPDALLPREHGFRLVLEPLHIGDEHLGFAVFDADRPGVSERDGALYRELGDLISAALQAVGLFDEVRRARDAAEQASRFQTRLLAHVTGELRSPVRAMLRRDGGDDPAGALAEVRQDAARLLHLIDDLLDLARSEADDLVLVRRLTDPLPVVREACDAAAELLPGHPRWALDLPVRLPAVRCDETRLRQILRNLLTAAADRSADGPVTVTARLHPRGVRITVAATAATALSAPTDQTNVTDDPTTPTAPAIATAPAAPTHPATPTAPTHPTGPMTATTLSTPAAPTHPTDPRAPADLTEPPAEPLAERPPEPPTARPSSRGHLDVGLATARRLAMMHGGSLTGGDSAGPARYRLDLPLPSPDGHTHLAAPDSGPLLVVTPGEIAADVRLLAVRHGLGVQQPDPAYDTDPVESRSPAAVVWDARADRPQEWREMVRLHDHPALRHTPFLLYGAAGADLRQALWALRPPGVAEPVVVAGRSPRSRERLRRLAEGALPDYPTRVVADGATVLALVAEEPPHLVVLERSLSDMQAWDVVDRLHDGSGHALCPAAIVGHLGLTAVDARRARPHPALLVLDLDVFTQAEAASLVRRLTRMDGRAPARTSACVREALVFLYENYRGQFSRWQVARAAGVSPDHLGKLFRLWYGLTVWEYLTRLRIRRAAERLRAGDDSIQSVARAVGFRDRAYFSRAFRKATGIAPHAFRASPPTGAGGSTGSAGESWWDP